MLKREERAARLLSRLQVALVETRFPENIGMAARACANMGLADLPGAAPLRLVAPERLNRDRALALATPKGAPVLEAAAVHAALADAVADSALVLGATARLGGWRRNVLDPAAAAALAMRSLAQGQPVSLVFGPEDHGLANGDIAMCTHVVHIPTSPRASSLNLAQSVLILLYECRKAALADETPAAAKAAPSIAHREREMLYNALQEALVAIDSVPGDNPAYFMQPVRRFFNRVSMSREEFDLFMGIARQIKWIAARGRPNS